MGPDVASMVDLDRYPVLGPSEPVFATLVDGARTQLAGTVTVELPGFVHADGVAALVADALAPRAHHSAGVGTAYLEFLDFILPEDHPRLARGHYAVGAVP